MAIIGLFFPAPLWRNVVTMKSLPADHDLACLAALLGAILFVSSCRPASPPSAPGTRLKVDVGRSGALVGFPASSLNAGADADAQRVERDRLVREYLEALSSHKVPKVEWRDSPQADAPPQLAPVLLAQHALRTLLDGHSFRRAMTAGPLRALRFFKDGEKGPVWAIWSAEPCGPVALRPLADPVTITDLAGNSQTIRPREESVIVTPSPSPLFVKLSTLEIMAVTPLLSVVEDSAGVCLEIWNPFSATLTAEVTIGKAVSSPTAVKIGQGGKERVLLDKAASSGRGHVRVEFKGADIPPAEMEAAVAGCQPGRNP